MAHLLGRCGLSEATALTVRDAESSPRITSRGFALGTRRRPVDEARQHAGGQICPAIDRDEEDVKFCVAKNYTYAFLILLQPLFPP